MIFLKSRIKLNKRKWLSRLKAKKEKKPKAWSEQMAVIASRMIASRENEQSKICLLFKSTAFEEQIIAVPEKENEGE